MTASKTRDADRGWMCAVCRAPSVQQAVHLRPGPCPHCDLPMFEATAALMRAATQKKAGDTPRDTPTR